MAKPAAHIVAGAVAALLPDVLLLGIRWRKKWLPRTHPLVRAHAAIHGPAGFGISVALGFASHLILDRYTRHDLAPGIRGRRPWRW
jgi:hypothetical protein